MRQIDWQKKMSVSEKLLMLVMMLLLGLTTSCTTMGLGGTRIVTDTSCAAFKPITWSRKDTRETQEQIIEHNAVYKALCPQEQKAQ